MRKHVRTIDLMCGLEPSSWGNGRLCAFICPAAAKVRYGLLGALHDADFELLLLPILGRSALRDELQRSHLAAVSAIHRDVMQFSFLRGRKAPFLRRRFGLGELWVLFAPAIDRVQRDSSPGGRHSDRAAIQKGQQDDPSTICEGFNETPDSRLFDCDGVAALAQVEQGHDLERSGVDSEARDLWWPEGFGRVGSGRRWDDLADDGWGLVAHEMRVTLRGSSWKRGRVCFLGERGRGGGALARDLEEDVLPEGMLRLATMLCAGSEGRCSTPFGVRCAKRGPS